MKVYEIIYEAPQQATLPGMGINTLQNAPGIAANAVKNGVSGAGSNWTSPLGKFSPKAPKWASKESLINYVKDVASRSPITRAPLSTKRMKILGNYLRIAQWLNFYEFAVQYGKEADVIDEMIKAGPDAKDAEGKNIGLSADDGAVAKRLILEQLGAELVSGGIIASIVGKIIKIIPFARYASRGVGALISIFTGGALSAVAVGEILAVEAIAITLQRWLESPDGKRVIMFCVLYMIDPTIEIFYNAGMDRFLGEFKHMSEQGGETLDVNKTVSGTPSSELVTKAGTALKGAADTVAQTATKTADKAFGTNTNKAYNDLVDRVNTRSGGDDTLSTANLPGANSGAGAGSVGDKDKVNKTSSEPTDQDKDMQTPTNRKANAGEDPINATPEEFQRWYGFPKPTDPEKLKKMFPSN
jgi:hypothetical protein